MQTFKTWLRYLGATLLLVSAIVAIEILLEQPMGLFSGSRPSDLGFNASKFKACSAKPNCVSSTTDVKDAQHYIEPLKFSGAPDVAWKRLKQILAATPRTVVGEQAHYLRLEFKSARMGFVDDVEFALDPTAQVIHVRSASRLGVRDFGVNRARIESIRTRFSLT